ncbi:MAG: EF-hand domain-containing protein [Sulfurimonas sp.]|nr:EF-hand domain-containing protein [Sulfurimonas sp.]
MKTKIIVCAIALGSLLGLSAAGMGGGMQNRTSFSGFDLNNDGLVTKVEFAQVRAQKQEARAKTDYPMRNVANAPSFESIDTNSDGKITPDEFSQFRQNSMGQRGKGMQNR